MGASPDIWQNEPDISAEEANVSFPFLLFGVEPRLFSVRLIMGGTQIFFTLSSPNPFRSHRFNNEHRYGQTICRTQYHALPSISPSVAPPQRRVLPRLRPIKTVSTTVTLTIGSNSSLPSASDFQIVTSAHGKNSPGCSWPSLYGWLIDICFVQQLYKGGLSHIQWQYGELSQMT